MIHFPIHARSSQAIIPSTTARNVVAMNRPRSVNRNGHRSRNSMASDPVARTRNQNGMTRIVPPLVPFGKAKPNLFFVSNLLGGPRGPFSIHQAWNSLEVATGRRDAWEHF